MPRASIALPVDLNIRKHWVSLTCAALTRSHRNDRFDLFFPEPHVKVRWVRLLLQSRTKPYVRWRTGVGYDATYLLSPADRSRGLRANLGQQWVLA